MLLSLHLFHLIVPSVPSLALSLSIPRGACPLSTPAFAFPFRPVPAFPFRRSSPFLQLKALSVANLPFPSSLFLGFPTLYPQPSRRHGSTTAGSLGGDNRLLNPRSSYERIPLAPPGRLIDTFTWPPGGSRGGIKGIGGTVKG
jgi:hypothetical protein